MKYEISFEMPTLELLARTHATDRPPNSCNICWTNCVGLIRTCIACDDDDDYDNNNDGDGGDIDDLFARPVAHIC